MYQHILFGASLLLASTVQAQTPERALMSHTPAGYHRFSGTATERPEADPSVSISGERALLGQVEGGLRPSAPATPADRPIDGSRALMGNWSSVGTVVDGEARKQSYFRAEVRGEFVASASGEAQFGAVQNPDRSAGAFVLSLGVCSPDGAILFTRRNGAPLGVGRYRVSAEANGADEILALIITGPTTSPTGAFRGQSGWLVVTAASDRVTTGRFQVEAVGFTAAEPEQEDRQLNVAGSFTATIASSSFRACPEVA